MSYEVTKSETSYTGKVFNIQKDTITLPNGKTTIRETICHNGAAAMIPIDENGDIIFVKQYRHSAKSMVLEIPAGTIEKGEDPLHCAIREIEEETSYKAGEMAFLMKFYSAIGFCNEIIYLYLATNLEKSNFNFDDDEFITLERHSLSESLKLIENGTICDSKTIIAILTYKNYLETK